MSNLKHNSRLDSKDRVIVISGMPGIGKTELALQTAHRYLNDNSDINVSLYVNLHGFTPDVSPAHPEVVLDALLKTIGINLDNLYRGIEEKSGMWRSAISNHNSILILDNVRDEKQIYPLVPGNCNCFTIITSRNILQSLKDADEFKVDVLNQEDSIDLLEQTSGRKICAKVNAFEGFYLLSGGVPLIVSVIGARLKHRPKMEFDWLVSEMLKIRSQLSADISEHGDIDAVFESSYYAMDDTCKIIYRRLGLFPGSFFTPEIASVLSGLELEKAKTAIEYLFNHSLLMESELNKFQMHDQILSHARRKAHYIDTKDIRNHSERTLLDWYFKIVNENVSGLLDKINEGLLSSGLSNKDFNRNAIFRSVEKTLKWIDEEQENILACLKIAERNSDKRGIQIAEIMGGPFLSSGYPILAKKLYVSGLSIARNLHDNLSAANMLLGLGVVNRFVGDYPLSTSLLLESYRIYINSNNKIGRSRALYGLGENARVKSDFKVAKKRFFQALLASPHDDKLGKVKANAGLGEVFIALNQIQMAVEHLKISLELDSNKGLAYAYVLVELGEAERSRGNYLESQEYYAEALRIYTDLDSPRGKANIYYGLGELYLLLEKNDDSYSSFREAEAICQKIGNSRGLAYSLMGIGTTKANIGKIDEAIDHYTTSKSICKLINDERGYINALVGMSDAYCRINKYTMAKECAKEAIDIVNSSKLIVPRLTYLDLRFYELQMETA